MTDDTSISFDGSIRTEQELQSVLQSVLQSANESGIDPQGTWDIKNGSTNPDWEVMVLELVKGAGD